MAQLKQSLGGVQFFSIGFGGVVGVGWIVYMGLWFGQAGPVGTTIAFIVGGLLMALVALCYAEVGSLYPVAGGEAVYAYRAFGPLASFVVGWALVLMLIAVVPYVSISLAWILDVLVPGIGGPVLYSWRGQQIQALSLVIALGWTLWLGFLNFRGIRSAAKFQDWLTYGKIAISLLFFAAAIFGGSTANLEPMFVRTETGSIWPGLLAVLATTPWFFAGFNEIPQIMEERSPTTSSRTLGLIVVAAVLAAGVYYGLAAFTTGMTAPWTEIAREQLPVAVAFRKAFGNELFARLVLLSGLFGIITVGNGASLAGSRLLFALSRARMISTGFTRVHPVTGAPVAAIVFITVFGILGNFLGRAGIAPIVAVGASGAALAYFFTSMAVWRLRQLEPSRYRPYRIPAGIAVSAVASAGSLFLLGSSIRQHWVDAGGGFPLEWMVILGWAAIGWLMWRAAAKDRSALAPGEQERILLGESNPDAPGGHR